MVDLGEQDPTFSKLGFLILCLSGVVIQDGTKIVICNV